MLWHWLLGLAAKDAYSAGLSAFVWLAAVLLGLAWYAPRLLPRWKPGELELLHRRIDDLRDRIRSSRSAGEQTEQLVARLEQLCRQLPANDARRRQ